MAFHIACPLTCRKICYCSFGNPNSFQQSEGKQVFSAAALVKLLASPYVAFGGQETVDVLVPCLPKDVKNKRKILEGRENSEDGLPVGSKRAKDVKGKHKAEGHIGRENVQSSAASKAISNPKRLTITSTADTDEASKGEHVTKHAATKIRVVRHLSDPKAVAKGSCKSGASSEDDLGAPVRLKSIDGASVEDLTQHLLPHVACGLCSVDEIIGREREKRMLSCNACSKKYHRKCVKQWAESRDLFDWRSWVCGSCRSCEVCRRTGDPDKLMFCKRCDAALHIYCQQPPLKHVPKGPYLCPKHTRCHSCGSNVPGSGVSSRWFLSFTTCDACGRLFVKDKYCPVCLKVYRDSEATPMVCCDSCEHWVHCPCDGISDEKYNQFQSDDNLRYKCPACRGDCHKVRGVEDAVRELWKRRDKADAQQRAKLSAAAGLPPADVVLNLCPSSDDEKLSEEAPEAHSKRDSSGSAKLDPGRKSKKDALVLGSKNDCENTGEKVFLQRINVKRPRMGKFVKSNQMRSGPL